MGKTALTVLIVLLLTHSLAIFGILGYGLATERLDEEKRQQYLATWRGEKLVPPPPVVEVVVEEETPQEAGARILAAQLEREILTREMELYAQLIRDKEITVKEVQAKLEKDVQELQTSRDNFAAEVQKQNDDALAEGFQKALKNYSAMKAKNVKDDFMTMEDKDAVRYLSAMKTDIATGVLEQFRTAEELLKRQKLLKMLENYGKVDLSKKDELVTRN